MTTEEIRQGMARHAWYHTIDLGGGLVTPGQYDHRPLVPRYGLPETLRGKTALDVGPAHGFFAFELERRGAARVVTVELPRWSAHDASPSLKAEFAAAGTDTTSAAYLHGALQFAIEARQSRVEQRFASVYELSPESIGVFDLVFCGSLLIHVSDPVRALYALRSVTRECAIIATAIDPDCARPSVQLLNRLLPRRLVGRPRAFFHGTVDGQAFWAPNMTCLEQWCLAAGYRRVERVSTFVLASLDGRFRTPHGVVRALP